MNSSSAARPPDQPSRRHKPFTGLTSAGCRRSPRAARGKGTLKWAIAITASLGAILEVIDTSIVNVALPDIQGNLGATLSEAGWVSTGYACANVVIIPLTAWLGYRFGKKNYLVFSLIGFTVASALCGLAPNLPFLVFARAAEAWPAADCWPRPRRFYSRLFRATNNRWPRRFSASASSPVPLSARCWAAF